MNAKMRNASWHMYASEKKIFHSNFFFLFYSHFEIPDVPENILNQQNWLITLRAVNFAESTPFTSHQWMSR